MVPLACVVAADDAPAEESTGTPTTSTTSDDTTGSQETTETPPDDTTTTGVDTGSGTEMASSSDGGGGGQQCGNGEIEGTELCDCGTDFCSPAGLNGGMCAGLVNPAFPERVYTGGILDCSMASCQYVFTQCSYCGDGVLNGNEICELDDDPNVSCQDLGLGSSTNDLPCGLDCQIDTTCCETPEAKECQ
jgi:hypothetical protein